MIGDYRSDVNEAVHDLLSSIQVILDTLLCGMYLVGSLALGDFDPEDSDLDLIIVTVGTLSEATITSLRELHQRFDQSESVWAARLDAVYIPQEVLREPFPAPTRYPVLQWPGLLALEPLETGWPIQRYTLREYGIVVNGPDPRSLFDPVNPDDLRKASAAVVERWQEQAHGDRNWIDWLREPANFTYVVLTLCRLLYTLDTGSVASKPVAVSWVEQTLMPLQTRLIRHAGAGEHSREYASENEVNEALALLEHTHDRYQQWRASSTNSQM